MISENNKKLTFSAKAFLNFMSTGMNFISEFLKPGRRKYEGNEIKIAFLY